MFEMNKYFFYMERKNLCTDRQSGNDKYAINQLKVLMQHTK